MIASSTFWHDLEAQFRALPDPKEGLIATFGEGKWLWGVTGGSRDKLQAERLEELFSSLAKKAAIAAGVPPGANVVDGWLDLLRKESPHFSRLYENATEIPDEGGQIQNLVLASTEYCYVLANRAFELEKAAQAGPPITQADEAFTNDEDFGPHSEKWLQGATKKPAPRCPLTRYGGSHDNPKRVSRPDWFGCRTRAALGH
jgi:hypothetical protein